MKTFLKHSIIWLLPILCFAFIAPFTPWLDLKLSAYFYKDGHFSHDPFLKAAYDYAALPVDIVMAFSLITLGGSYFIPNLKRLRPYALYFILVITIGAGIITHVFLKDHWGRPRPKQIEQFGGSQEFRPFYKPNFFNQPEPSKSFACGHCSVGFFFFVFIFVGKRLKKKGIFYFGVLSSLSLGILFSYARIAQGGHFLSDTLMTALIMWLTSFVLDRVIFEKR